MPGRVDPDQCCSGRTLSIVRLWWFTSDTRSLREAIREGDDTAPFAHATGAGGTPDPVTLQRSDPGAVEACAVCRTDLHVIDGDLPIQSCRSTPGTRSSAGSMRRARACCNCSGSASECRGSAIPVAIASTACRIARTSAMRRCLPATRVTAALPPMLSPMRPLLSSCWTTAILSRLAPLLCAGLIGWRSLVAAGLAQGHRHSTGSGRPLISLPRFAFGRGTVFAFTRPGDVRRRLSHVRSARPGPADRTRSRLSARRRHHLRVRREISCRSRCGP